LKDLIKKDKKQRYLLSEKGHKAYRLLLGQKNQKSMDVKIAFSVNHENENLYIK